MDVRDFFGLNKIYLNFEFKLNREENHLNFAKENKKQKSPIECYLMTFACAISRYVLR